MAEFLNRCATAVIALAVLVVLMSMLNLPHNPARQLLDWILNTQ